MSHDETNQPTTDDTRPRLWPDGSPMTEPVWHTGFSLCDCEHCTADDEHMTKTEAINYIRTEMETVLDDDSPARMESLVDELVDQGYGEEAAYELIFDTQEWVEPEGFQNHVGDGPSGFDYYHDTKWCC